MFPKDDVKTYVLSGGKLKAYVLESGNLKEIRDEIVRINTYVGNNLEPTVSNIYLRVNNSFTRLLGIGSPSKFSILEDEFGKYAVYYGVFNNVQYHIILSCYENVLLYQVKLDKTEGVDAEVYYGMDVSLQNIYAISNNEAYVSQYIDHNVFRVNDSYIIASRQNSDNNYYLESGSFGKVDSYSVDGFQFFGLNFKFDGIPLGLKKKKLDSKIYQYEFAYHALKGKRTKLDNDYEITFYSCYSDSHKERVTAPIYQEHVMDVYEKLKKRSIKVERCESLELKISFLDTLKSKRIDEKTVDKLFTCQDDIEYIDNKKVSFFNKDDKSHVVYALKEKYLERPSGNIIYSINRDSENHYDFENVLASTGYIFGLFNSQIVIGNTSFNKFISNSRNPLNIQKITGQRIFIKHKGKYKLLTLPYLFVMGFNYLKWLYKIDNDILEFTSFTSNTKSKLEFSFKSHKNKKYDLIITNNLVMGEREHESKVHVNRLGDTVEILFDASSMTHSKYPDLNFKMVLDKPFKLSDDRVFYQDNQSRSENMLSILLNEASFNLLITKSEEDSSHLDFITEKNKTNDYIKELSNNFEISEDTGRCEISSLNYLIYWYSHDALVHYISPHGLEQYNGAAWGTRDVCQGPAEYFLAFNKYENVKRIILDVYKHQFYENGDFPQWFMFDKFYNIQDLSSHGDIIVWPLRLLALYLEVTKDYEILDSMVEYTSRNGVYYTEKYKLSDHISKEIEAIKNSFINGTFLSCYGGGDWDDTLQPANPEYKKEMVSGWTTSLTYEAFLRLGKELIKSDSKKIGDELIKLSSEIKKDYHKYIICDGVPSGFVHFKDGKVMHVIHPNDEESQIRYRLLPLTRGIISGMFNHEESRKMMNIIFNNLLFPDGVRLMSDAVKYNGGIKTYFNRAETAANFGREIGLMYSHANVRYAEALSKLGFGSNMLNALSVINPVISHSIVKNSLPRQRCSYFSSSDGAFNTRYEAYKKFGKLKTGSALVKGGWRVYSSGPGIFTRTLIEDFIGIKVYKDEVVLKPCLDHSMHSLDLRFDILGRKTLFKYHLNELKKKLIINGLEVKPFNDEFKFNISLLDKDENLIDVYLDNTLVNKEVKGCLDYFLNESPNGLSLDKIFTDHKKDIASMASTGFNLASLVIGVERGLISYDDAYKYARKTFDSAKKIEKFKGLLPHFIITKTLANNKSEFSTIDSAIFLMGALAAGYYFKGDILDDALKLVNGVDWDHFITKEDDRYVIKMAYSNDYWKESGGYTKATWNHYAEQLMIYYLYALKDDTTSEMSQNLYNGFIRHHGVYKDYELIHCYSNALFIHQFTHAFIDFRKIVPNDGIDWHLNSLKASLANRLYCINEGKFKTYNSLSWGLSAFQGKTHYQVYGAPPWGFPENGYHQKLDGSVAPYASLSSAVFIPKEALSSLEYFNTVDKLDGKYGLFDSYSFDSNYVSNCCVGIDKGPTIIMLDNFQKETIWNLFMNDMNSRRAFIKLGFKLNI